jgi:hypothetical protein
MEDVKNVEKNLVVGDGNNKYKGVADKDVKIQIGQSMAKNGLTILPIKIEPKVNVERYVDQYNKPKQKVFTEVLCTYLLSHTSGEFITLQGYGHGDDSQDKSAGKATTYALKYALLYTFLVPTGNIDDADTEHSDKKDIPNTPPEVDKKWLNLLEKDGSPNKAVLDRLQTFFNEGKSLDELEQKVKISQKDREYIVNLFNIG